MGVRRGQGDPTKYTVQEGHTFNKIAQLFRRTKDTFKIISVLAVVFLAMFFVQPNVALAGNFSQTCDSAILYKDHPGVVYAHCQRWDGSWNEQAGIQLNDWITNSNGWMSWHPGGNFLSTCEWNTDDWNVTSLNPNNRDAISLRTFCQDSQGGRRYSDLNLNEHIDNENGNLKYSG